MKKSFYLPYILALASLMACTSTPKSKPEAQAVAVSSFVLPTLPTMITDPQERVNYLSTHYWEHFNFKDTTLVSRPEITEQALVNFLDLLPRVPETKASEALKKVMASATADSIVFKHFTELMDKYLYDPNSPFRNEEFYISVLESIIQSPNVSEDYKSRPRYRLEMALKNRRGTMATNFSYTLANGRKQTLWQVKAPYILLFFNNPDCTECKATKAFIEQSQVMQPLIQSGKLKVVSIYPDDDLKLWKRTGYPTAWINGHNSTLSDEQVYDLKAIPTLYLLDQSKRVLLKDASIQQIEQWGFTH